MAAATHEILKFISYKYKNKLRRTDTPIKLYRVSSSEE